MDEAVAAGARLEKAAETIGLTRQTVFRWRILDGGEDGRKGPNSPPANRLGAEERRRIVEVVNSPEFRGLSPAQIVPLLADRGIYWASESTIYRILREENMLKHRQAAKPATGKRPRELSADGPNQVWSWDITYLPTTIRGQFLYLYLFMDVWSRRIMSAVVFGEESMDHAAQLFQKTCLVNGVAPRGLVLHSDNGGPMKGSTMLATLQRLGVVPSFSRPGVGDDNPFSEALFRTLKYRPEYPKKPFENEEDAQAWVDGFTAWYNEEHLHGAIRFVTPDDRHCGREREILENRRRVYQNARENNPERWAANTRNWDPVKVVRLNPKNGKQTSPEQQLGKAA